VAVGPCGVQPANCFLGVLVDTGSLQVLVALNCDSGGAAVVGPQHGGRGAL